MKALEEFESKVEALIKESSLPYEEIADSLEFLSQEYRAKTARE